MVDILGFAAEVLLEGLGLFSAPFVHPIMLWVIIPILINLFATEIFQERGGTSMGNAMTNGIIGIWVGIDWMRNIMLNFSGFDVSTAIKIFLCVFMYVFGIAIIVLGVRGSKIIRYVGRIREITYFNLVFTPIVYGFYEFSLITIVAIIVYFPIFYFVVAIIDRLTPDFSFQKAEKEEAELGLPEKESGPALGTGFGEADVFGEKKAAEISTCPYCNRPLRYIPQYQRYYCDSCRRYI